MSTEIRRDMILKLVKAICSRVKEKEGYLNKTKLIKYLYLIDLEHYILPACELHRITVVAYSPFGQGRLIPGPVLEEIARARGATARQVALRFLVRHPGIFAIPKATDMQHVEENAGAGDLRLSDQEIRQIADAFPISKPRHRYLPRSSPAKRR